jgi:hypothetical protein
MPCSGPLRAPSPGPGPGSAHGRAVRARQSGVDVGRRGALVALVVDPGAAGQAVALRRRLGRPAHHQARHRQAMVGQSRKSAISFHRDAAWCPCSRCPGRALQRQRGGLRQDDGVEARHVPADEVGKAQPRLALRQPLPRAVLSAQKVSTSGACSTIGWSKCRPHRCCLRAGSVVLTTDTMFRLPLDELPCSDSTSTRSTSAGSGGTKPEETLAVPILLP